MPQRSNIEWTDYTSNPLVVEGGGWGCTKVSPGCVNCYAEMINKRFGNMRPFTGSWRFEIKEKEIQRMLKSKAISGKRVFVCDMCDLFHEDVPDELIDRLFAVFALRHDVTWQVLTKRAKRMAEYLDRGPVPCEKMRQVDPNRGVWAWPGWPLPNVWLGVSAEDQQRADDRLPWLIKCQAEVRFVSAEPLLEEIDFLPIDWDLQRDRPSIDWVIVGGESGPRARPCKVEWVESIVNQCNTAGVQVFVKQMGSCWAKKYETSTPPTKKGSRPVDWPESIRVREFPR